MYYKTTVGSSAKLIGSTALPGREYTWTLLSNYAHVLICLANDPHLRLRDVATQVGITERAVQRIVTDLEKAKLLSRERRDYDRQGH